MIDTTAPRPSIPGMFDVILRGTAELDTLLQDDRALPDIVQRLVGISVLGLSVHGAVVGLIRDLLHGTGPNAVLWMPLAFVVAFVGALCICLPSFYFYTQLSGLDASFRLVTAQALRAQATTSVLLLGVMPFYGAVALAAALGVISEESTVLGLGMVLPFVVGLTGLRAAYRGFIALAKVLPKTHERRGAFLRRMVLAWGAVYTSVAPVALWRLVERLGG